MLNLAESLYARKVFSTIGHCRYYYNFPSSEPNGIISHKFIRDPRSYPAMYLNLLRTFLAHRHHQLETLLTLQYQMLWKVWSMIIKNRKRPASRYRTSPILRRPQPILFYWLT